MRAVGNFMRKKKLCTRIRDKAKNNIWMANKGMRKSVFQEKSKLRDFTRERTLRYLTMRFWTILKGSLYDVYNSLNR